MLWRAFLPLELLQPLRIRGMRSTSDQGKLPRSYSLAPVISTNIAVDYLSEIYAVDASLGRGAVVSTSIDESLTELLWLGSDKKGGYCLMDSPVKHLQAAAGLEIEYDEEPNYLVGNYGLGPFKAPLLYFDFVEFCGGSGRVSACCADLGLSVAPPLDLSNSQHYNISELRFLEWALFMIHEKRFRSFMQAPPCTSFSPAAWPAVRSYTLCPCDLTALRRRRSEETPSASRVCPLPCWEKSSYSQYVGATKA